MTCHCSQRVVLGGMILLAGFLRSGNAQDTQDAKALAQDSIKQRQAEFEEYRFQRERPKPVELVMESRSILNWSNPERGSGAGAVFEAR